MKSSRFFCVFVILVSVLVVAQSNLVPLNNQSNDLRIPQGPLPQVPPNLSQLTQGAVFAQSGATAFTATGTLAGAAPMQQGADFAKAVQYNSGAGWHIQDRAAVADVNGDGKPDLLVADMCNDESDNWDCNGLVAVLLGNGDGTFQAAVTYGSGGWKADSVTVADINRDGKPDLLVANECNPAPSHCFNGRNGLVGVLLGNGDGTFRAAVTYDSGGYRTTSVAVADVNGDGTPDLVVANQCASFGSVKETCNGTGTVGVLLGNGDGTFQTAVTYGSGGYFADPDVMEDLNDSVVVADVNGDGTPDLLVSNQCTTVDCKVGGTVGVLLGNGDGTFQTALTYGSGGYLADSVAVADVNGDEKPDLLVANRCASYVNDTCGGNSTVGVLLGKGDGTFHAAVTYGSGGSVADSVVVADVNGDGTPDLLVANECGTTCNGVVGLLLGNGDGTFQAAVTFKAGGRAYSIAAADVNGDGKPDLLVGNKHDHGAVAVLLNSLQ